MYQKLVWRILDGRTHKDKIGKICSDIAEANHALQSIINSNVAEGSTKILVFHVLTEKQRNDIKVVIQKIRFLIGFASNIQNILTKKVILVVLKLMTSIHTLS